jgi:hypothetical protein
MKCCDPPRQSPMPRRVNRGAFVKQFFSAECSVQGIGLLVYAYSLHPTGADAAN